MKGYRNSIVLDILEKISHRCHSTVVRLMPENVILDIRPSICRGTLRDEAERPGKCSMWTLFFFLTIDIFFMILKLQKFDK